jgi:arginine utilization regulatory protein
MGIRKDYKDILIIDEAGKIEYFSIHSMDFFGFKPNELIGTTLLQHYGNLKEENSTMLDAVSNGATHLGVVQELEVVGGNVVRQKSDTFSIRNGGKVIGAVEFAYYEEEEDLVATKASMQAKGHYGKKVQVFQPKVGDIIGKSKAMAEVQKKLARIVDLESPVLLIGETGTGKEMTARAIHNSGRRQKGNFVYVNCSALPENLFESILFGVKRGSFTDAAEREGLFYAANNGTIFLDEIQSMPLATQGKILRVLEEKRIRPIGGEEELNVDVRIIAACNLDMDSLLSSETLRKDLYFRLSVIQLELPPLRQRTGDVQLLTDYYLKKFNEEIEDRGITGIDNETAAFFESYDWPGNVRELRNTLESAFYVAKGRQIVFSDVQERFEREKEEGPFMSMAGKEFLASGKDLKAYLSDFQKRCIEEELKKHGGNLGETARALKISDQMMKYNLKKFGIDTDRFIVK